LLSQKIFVRPLVNARRRDQISRDRCGSGHPGVAVCGGKKPLHRGRLPLTFKFDFQRENMADAANKYAENVDGKFYVDDQCIDCDLCRETAPANFKRNDDGGHSFVYKQPETPDEEALCKEAMEGCPVEAIGPDGP
jgi:ferredoxin